MDEHELMRIHADILFSYDARGRMLRSNDLVGRAAPRLFLGYTPGGYIVRYGVAAPDSLVQRVTEIVEREPPPDTLQPPPAILAALREALAVYSPVLKEESGPAYRFPESIRVSPDAVQLTAATVEVARDTYPWLEHELPSWEPCFAVVRDGVAVSICFSSRLASVAAEAGVNTLPAFRGRGYAAAVTAAWGAAVRASGRIPLYSTAWDNLASQGVARRLGLIMYGAEASWD